MVLYLYVLEVEHSFPWLRGNHFLPFLLYFQKLLEILACELCPSSSQALGSSFLLPAESLLPKSLLCFTLFLFSPTLTRLCNWVGPSCTTEGGNGMALLISPAPRYLCFPVPCPVSPDLTLECEYLGHRHYVAVLLTTFILFHNSYVFWYQCS